MIPMEFSIPDWPYDLPHGVTLIGRLFEEGTLALAGIALERAFGGDWPTPAGILELAPGISIGPREHRSGAADSAQNLPATLCLLSVINSSELVAGEL